MRTEQIILPRLRVAELHAFAEQAIAICKPHGMLGTALQNVERLFAEFAKSFTKPQASAKEKLQLDKDRDALLSGFFYAVKSSEYYPYQGQAAETIVRLAALAGKYSTIRRMSQNEETAQISSMLAELGQIDLSPVQDSGINRWVQLIQAANENFKAAAGEYISDTAEAKLQESAYKLAPELTDALEALATMFYAFMTIQPTPELEKSYAQLSVLADTYR